MLGRFRAKGGEAGAALFCSDSHLAGPVGQQRLAAPKSGYDIVVVGGGGHGLGTAYCLARTPVFSVLRGVTAARFSNDRRSVEALLTFRCDALAVSGGWSPTLHLYV